MNRSDSRGSNDLFVSFYVRDNVWSAPINMGDVLNTKYQETTPYITPDKRFLYFSSNRPGGPGGNDIYVSERLDYTWLNWSTPVLLEGEANSSFDDSQPYFDPDNHYMYFTSRRDGSSDIFRLRLIPKPSLKKPVFIKGKIVDARTGRPIRCELFWGQQSSKEYLEYFNSYNGQFEATLSEYEPYKFLPRKPGYSAQQILIDPRIIEKQGKDTADIVLYIFPPEDDKMILTEQESQKINSETQEVQVLHSGISSGNQDSLNLVKKFVLYNIQFVKAKPVILTKSSQALNDLVMIMKSNSTLEIRIEGHTDNIGDELSLINLSEQRAATVRDYLVNHGVESKRIQIIGLGASHPINENTTEKGREKNRRVEIKIIKR
jgi:outer membrane protein OmpA-like peptidoglycan-associated protein